MLSCAGVRNTRMTHGDASITTAHGSTTALPQTRDVVNSGVPHAIKSFGIGLSGDSRSPAWCASAAYLYVLRLDRSCLAWEYLRRNPRYATDWQTPPVDGVPVSLQWGLGAFENPYLDARVAEPMWRPRPKGEFHIVPLEEAPPGNSRFDLWTVPGKKTLSHDGRRLILSLRGWGCGMRIALDTHLCDGNAFGYVMPSPAPTVQPAKRFDTMISSSAGRGARASATAVGRDAIMHMRTLQALDGVRSGASQREVASALFGVDQAMALWIPDGELRARIRHYIRRGRELMSGAYMHMLRAAVTGRRHSPTSAQPESTSVRPDEPAVTN